MAEKLSRRKLLRKGTQALVAGGVSVYAASAAEELVAESALPSMPKGIDYYEKLGVSTFINAAGTYTILTASTMPPEVQAAVALAAKKPVHLMELHQAAGNYLAGKLRCGGALVTSGAAAALTLGTAACMTLGNKDAIASIPTDVTGLKNEVIVQKSHRYEYDHAMRNCGVKVIEVETMEQYENAFTEKTVMTNFFNAVEAPISREDWIRIAHKHGVPCFNDAAADVPPISNLWNYTQMGFDLVAFSGGKGMRGPQCTGLLLGRKDLIEVARLNNSPNSNAVGRGLKVAKEEIIGMVAAVDWFLAQDDAAMEFEFRKRANRIADHLKKSLLWKRECLFLLSPITFHTFWLRTIRLASKQRATKSCERCVKVSRASKSIPALEELLRVQDSPAGKTLSSLAYGCFNRGRPDRG